ncbi:MAG: sulfite exporter TauE/SafE family protein [Candidatus Limnocylindria bacterium]
MHWQWPVGAVLAFGLAFITTPAGVSGAVLLLPIQLSVLHVPSPSVTPTNLLFNVAATPGGLLRFGRERRLRGPLTRVLVAGTLPGVVLGAILRVELLSGGRAFEVIVAFVLLPLGLWLILGAGRAAPPRPEDSRAGRRAIWLLALVVGTIGGIYGIGGGSVLAPILIALGYSVYEVAPATLAATFLTSLAGIITYQVLQAIQHGPIAPQWVLGACLGAGGFAGSYCGARLQRHLPERSLRRLLGVVACLVAARYLQSAISSADGAGKTRTFAGATLSPTS